MIIKKRILAGLLAAPAALAFAAPAQAQVTGSIATVNQVPILATSKAYISGIQQIQAKYKTTIDQIEAQDKIRQNIVLQLDKNGDKQLDDAEIEAARKANSPLLKQADDATAQAQKLSQPILIAQAYVTDQVYRKYDAALGTVITAKKVSIVLNPDSLVYAPDAADISKAVLDEMDKTPGVSVEVPANWQTSREMVQLSQQVSQFSNLLQLRAAQQQQQQQPAGTAPAKPAATTPAKPGAKAPVGRE
jgi:Skp family chaperone for outer membrane proteins